MKNIKNNKTTPRIKVLIAIIVSLGVVSIFSPVVFIANTPNINPSVVADLGLIPYRVVAFLKNPLDKHQVDNEIATQKMGTTKPPTEDFNYTPISDNVYAAENPTTGEKYVQIKEGTVVEVNTVKLEDGRVVTVYVPVLE